MTDHPILMSAPMVRAILAGTKTQTRRAIKPQPESRPGMGCTRLVFKNRKGAPLLEEALEAPGPLLRNALCPYGSPGERLWLRETWAPLTKGYAYRADPCWNASPDGRWRSSIHMPRAASRITLEITEVRVQRLQDISEADAVAEGIVPTHDGYGLPDGSHFHAADPRICYWSLWDSINGQGSTESNPWVWAVSFRRVP
jgi:hypothetical protein